MRKASGSLREFTDLETWYWHAYDYAWRRVVLANDDTHSPLDPDGAWFNSGLVERAEAFFRAKYRKPKVQPIAPPAHPEEIREGCERIPWSRLTDNEREFLQPRMDAMFAKMRAGIEGIVARSRRAFRAPRHTHFEAPLEPAAADPRVQRPATPDRLRELNDDLGRRVKTTEDAR